MADLAKRFHREIPSHNNKFIVRCPVDYRNVFGLPSDYFGNAVRDAVTIFEVGGCPGLLVSNLSKFPIPKINLGLGSPIGFHHASLNSRLGLILPSVDGVEVRFKRPVAII